MVGALRGGVGRGQEQLICICSPCCCSAGDHGQAGSVLLQGGSGVSVAIRVGEWRGGVCLVAVVGGIKSERTSRLVQQQQQRFHCSQGELFFLNTQVLISAWKQGTFFFLPFPQ